MTLRRLAAFLLLVVLAVACTRSDAEPQPGPSTSATARPSPTPTPTPTLPGAALTGVPVAYGTPARPVVAVKVENSGAARPQSGLDAADLVFEELTEGGVTRFIAVFHSTIPEEVGPIRSVREVDAQVLAPFRTVLFTSGGQQRFMDMLAAAGVQVWGEDGSVLHRVGFRSAPHNVYATGEDLFRVAAERVPTAAPMGWSFDVEPPPGSAPCGDLCTVDPGRSITVQMSPYAVTGFEFDEPAGVYRRSQNGAPFTVTGEGRVGAANVVVIEATVGPGGCCDPAGNELTATSIIGGGRAVVLRDGRRYEARWSKPAVGTHLAITAADGMPFVFRPGPTWLLLAPPSALP